MGKYMRRRKSKTTSGEVVSSLMEEVPSLGGVLTRAKTLALQRAAAGGGGGGGSYIQLRSRRLVKPESVKKSKEICALEKGNPSKLGSKLAKLKGDCEVGEKLGGKEEGICGEIGVDLGIGGGDEEEEEGSFGENLVEIEDRGRSTRETTPCNLIRDPDAIRTPGSSTKPTRSSDNKYRVQNTTPRHIPTTSEMDEFFTGPEKQQQRLFIEKYNFDPVNEKPLRGRYEWVKVDGTKKS